VTRTPSRPLDAGPDFARLLASRTPVPFPHALHESPALSLESIAQLAEALPNESVVTESAVKPLVSSDYVPRFSTPREAGDRIRAIDESDAWMTLLNIEQVPRYRALIDEQLDGLGRRSGVAPTAWRRRMGFIFVSSPGSVTPAHFDIEHSLCIQLRGERTLTFGAFPDLDQRDSEVHRYWTGSFGRMESMPSTVSELHLAPGKAAYIPPWTPHWLNNGGAASLSITITFFNRDNEDESMVQAFNEKQRKLRIAPARYGVHPGADRVKALVMRANSAVKNRIRPPKPEARG
jgi:cupin superfamily protein